MYCGVFEYVSIQVMHTELKRSFPQPLIRHFVCAGSKEQNSQIDNNNQEIINLNNDESLQVALH